MFCQKCGTQFASQETQFCGKCGTPRFAQPPQQQAQRQPPRKPQPGVPMHPAQHRPMPPTMQRPAKSGGMTWWGWALIALVVLGVIGVGARTGSNTLSNPTPMLPAFDLATVSSIGSGSSGSSGSGSRVVLPTPALPTLPVAQTFKLGDAVAVKNWTLTAVKVESVSKKLVWTQFNNEITAAGLFVVVNVSLQNTANKPFSVHTWDFEIKDGLNRTYKISDEFGAFSYSQFKGGRLVSDEVPPGVASTVYLVFDVAPEANSLKLVFNQDSKPQISLGL